MKAKNGKKNDEELWIKIKDLIKSIIKNLDDYGEKYIRIEFYWNDELPLNITIETGSMIIVAWAIFH